MFFQLKCCFSDYCNTKVNDGTITTSKSLNDGTITTSKSLNDTIITTSKSLNDTTITTSKSLNDTTITTRKPLVQKTIVEIQKTKYRKSKSTSCNHVPNLFITAIIFFPTYIFSVYYSWNLIIFQIKILIFRDCCMNHYIIQEPVPRVTNIGDCFLLLHRRAK